MSKTHKKERNYLVPILRQRNGKGVHFDKMSRKQEKMDIFNEIEDELYELKKDENN